MQKLKRILEKNKLLAGFIVTSIVTIISATLIIINPLDSFHLKLSDDLYKLNQPSKDIIIIAIDEKSTQPFPLGLGRYGRWSRENHMKLLNILQKENPAIIAFDILFDSPTQSISFEKIQEFTQKLDENLSEQQKLEKYEEFIQENSSQVSNIIDNSLASKFQEFDNLVLAYIANEHGKTAPLKRFSIDATLGNTFVELDDDGIIRKVPITIEANQEKYENFSYIVAKKYLASRSKKTDIKIPSENNKMNVNFFADPFKSQQISYIDVINGNFEKDFFKNKIVLVGLTIFKEINDAVLTPKSNISPMPGVEVWANAIQTILEQKFLINQSKTSQIFTIAIISASLAIALNYLGIFAGTLLTLISIPVYIAAAHLFFRHGLILNMIYPFIAIVLTYLASWVYKYFIADKSKHEIKNAFKHYLSPDLIEEISKNPDQLKLGGQSKIITVFFSDIKDSTTISEKTPINQWVSQINEYFTAMESLIKNAKGTLDKYEGDAIMGFWNAPLDQPDHIFRAYVTALSMQKELKKLNQKWQQENRPLLEMRIGINTGQALVGNFGSENRFDYTAMGDTVNTASRLESAANKTYHTNIIVAGFENLTENTNKNSDYPTQQNWLTEEQKSQLVFRELDTVFLPGKKEAITIYELVCLAKDLTAQTKEIIAIYAQALALYRQYDYSKAIELLTKIPEDQPAQIFLKRCQILQSGGQISELNENKIYRIANK